jgi:hypothetical protein
MGDPFFWVLDFAVHRKLNTFEFQPVNYLSGQPLKEDVLKGFVVHESTLFRH